MNSRAAADGLLGIVVLAYAAPALAAAAAGRSSSIGKGSGLIDDAMILVAGALAHPAVMKALDLAPDGPPIDLPAGLAEAAAADGAGQVHAGQGQAVRVRPTAALIRYAEVMGLTPQVSAHGPVLALPLADAAGGPGGDAALAAAIARAVLASDQPADAVRRRLPMIAGWAASQQRAQAERGAPLPPGPADPDRLRIEAWSEPYARHFSVRQLHLRHKMHRGGWSEVMERAVFVSGDAVVVLPWDPVRDRVLVVDQPRAGPAARGDAQPWVYEPVAGRIDAGETPESTARREAEEEAGVKLGRMIAAPAHYPSPGIMAEYVYSFVGIADLPDESATVSGLETEGEDIRGTLIARETLTAMALDGRIVSGPLLILALWLDRHAAALRAQGV